MQLSVFFSDDTEPDDPLSPADAVLVEALQWCARAAEPYALHVPDGCPGNLVASWVAVRPLLIAALRGTDPPFARRAWLRELYMAQRPPKCVLQALTHPNC